MYRNLFATYWKGFKNGKCVELKWISQTLSNQISKKIRFHRENFWNIFSNIKAYKATERTAGINIGQPERALAYVFSADLNLLLGYTKFKRNPFRYIELLGIDILTCKKFNGKKSRNNHRTYDDKLLSSSTPSSWVSIEEIK